MPIPSVVTQVPPAPSNVALDYFESLLTFETDCWDVHHAMSRDNQDFVLVDVRSPEAFAIGHVPGAINIHHPRLTIPNLAHFPTDTIFIVYCAGPHCNGANKAAVRLARLGRPVKMMIGGIEGWKDEGFELVTDG